MRANWFGLCVLLALACSPATAPTPSLPLPPSGATLTVELSAAVDSALESLRAEPGDARRWQALAELYDGNSLTSAAEAAYRGAIELDPGDARSRHLLARLLVDAGDAEAALALEEQAVKLAPRAAHVLATHAELLIELGRVEEAHDVIEAALNSGVSSKEMHWELVRARVALGDAEGALDALTGLTEEDSEDAHTHHLRASALRALGRLDEAQAEAALGGPAVRNDPWVAEVAAQRIGFYGELERVQAAMGAGNLGEAHERLAAMHAADPANVNVAGMLSDVLLALERPADAERVLLRTGALAPDNHRVPYNLAVVHEWMQDLDQALLDWNRALELHPRFTMALVRRARLQAARGSTEEAANDLAEAKRLGDSSLDWFRQKAQLQATQGDLPGALDTLDDAVEQHTREAILFLLQAELRAASGDADGAHKALERATSIDPAHPRLERVRSSVERRLSGGGK